MPTQVIDHYLSAFGGPGAPVATPASPGSGFFTDNSGHIQDFDPIHGPMVISSLLWVPVSSLAANPNVWVVATMVLVRGGLTITPAATPAGVSYQYYYGDESIVTTVAQVSNQTTPWVRGIGIELVAPGTITLAHGDTLFASMSQGTSVPHPTMPTDWTQIEGLGGTFIGSST